MLANLSWYFLKHSLFSFYAKQHQKYVGLRRNRNLLPAMGTILLIVLKFSTSTNSFSVFPRVGLVFLTIFHVHRFRLSGNGCNFLWFISMKPPSLLLVFTPVFIHTVSLFLFVIHLGINIRKLVINVWQQVLRLCIFRISVMNDKAIWPISHFTEHSQSKEDIHHGCFKTEIKNETSSNSWENLTK